MAQDPRAHRAAARAGRPQPMRAWLAALLVLGVAGVAQAQGRAGDAPRPGSPDRAEQPPRREGADTGGGPAQNGGTADGGTADGGIARGVIPPPPTGDRGIHTTVPEPHPGTTPVIPPPGTPGGDPLVQPR